MEEEMKHKGLRVNMKTTKIMVAEPGIDLLRDSGAFPCVVCPSDVGMNSIQY